MKKKFLYLIPLMLVLMLARCKDEKPSNNSNTIVDTTVTTQDSLILLRDTIPQLSLINYKFISPPKQNRYKFLIEEYDTIGAKIILALNRLDERFIRKPDSIVVPDTIINDKLLYSPFPKHLALLDSVKKILLVDQRIQAFAAYEFGNLVNWGPTSTGKKSTPTPNGLFYTNWKSKKTISTDDSTWILKWYFNLENFRGVSLHQFELPGYPASHACVRLLEEDAFWIYYWAEQWIITKDGEFIIAYGTPVIIYGQYDFKGVKPWLLLPLEPPQKALVSEDELNEIINDHILIILTRQEERERVLNPQMTLQ
ncbi:MAG: L,D-transpeptidase [Ignavibacterium sp.]|uniref:L,D-transpeptidase n=1 Tax=Ignavibacterium sp. TaxID=2651167 RepID=UPI00404AB972